MRNTPLQYRTFSELMASVRGDLKTYSLEGMIDESELIQVARKVNFELGLKINPTRLRILAVEHGQICLPDDVHVMNSVYGLMSDCRCALSPDRKRQIALEQQVAKDCASTTGNASSFSNTGDPNTRLLDLKPGTIVLTHNYNTLDITVVASYQGRVIETLVEPLTLNTVAFTSFSNLNGVLVSVVPGKTVTAPVPSTPVVKCNEVVRKSVDTCQFVSPEPNPDVCHPAVQLSNQCGIVTVYSLPPLETRVPAKHKITLLSRPPLSSVAGCVLPAHQESFGWLEGRMLSFTGAFTHVLLDYQGAMENDEGELLVYDHPQLNEYYEYAIKQRIIENQALNGEPDQGRLSLIDNRLRPARINAISYTRMPDFANLLEVYQAQRRRMYQAYYQPFARFAR